jgi:mono/diheme cytochrome c family protein
MPEQQHYCSIASCALWLDGQSIEGANVNARILCILQCMMLYVLATVHPAATATGDAQAGKAIYERSCVGCHGPTGQGGRMAAMLAVPPRNLADQAYMGTRSDQQLFDVISKGGAAAGLSTAMTAFGSQLSEQQIWDTVAYIRTLVAGSETAAQPPSSPPSKASAPVADLAMARLRLSIWPEYDDPRVLIMLRGEMTPRQAFPASITLPIPKGAEIIGTGMISEQNELLLHPHQVLPGNTQDTLQLNLPVPRFFVEFYYNPFTASGPAKRFVYPALTTYPIELFEVDIQQPLKATAFTLDPAPMERMTDKQGFTYHQFTYRDVGKGQTQTFTITYTKTATAPSVAKPQPTPQPAEKARARSNNTLVSLGIFAGAILLFVGYAWLMHRSQRQHMPATTSPAPSVSMSDSLLTLLQEEAQPQGTADVPPTLEQTRVINFCANCGRKLLPDDRFCSGCGKPIKR